MPQIPFKSLSNTHKTRVMAVYDLLYIYIYSGDCSGLFLHEKKNANFYKDPRRYLKKKNYTSGAKNINFCHFSLKSILILIKNDQKMMKKTSLEVIIGHK